jgi:hypothetical protein
MPALMPASLFLQYEIEIKILVAGFRYNGNDFYEILSDNQNNKK